MVSIVHLSLPCPWAVPLLQHTLQHDAERTPPHGMYDAVYSYDVVFCQLM